MKRKKHDGKMNIFVYGYRNINLGDDLFFYILFSRYPQVNFVMFAPPIYKEIFKEFENVKIYTEGVCLLGLNRVLSSVFNGRNIRTTIAQNCDAAVRIMGASFGEKHQNRRQKTYFEPDVETVKKVYIVGANVEKIYTKMYYEQVKKYLARCEDVCFRENSSKEMFPMLSNVRVAPDIVFQLPKVHKATQKISEKMVIISVINMSIRKELNKYSDNYEEFLGRIISFFLKKNYKICMLSFCEKEGDEDYTNNFLLKSNYDLKQISCYTYTGKIDETIELIQMSQCIIATRFHSMILAWIYGKKVLPILYNSKMKNVIEDYGYKGSYVELNDLNNFNYEDFEKWQKEKIFDVSECIIESEKQFLGLDEFINEWEKPN